MGPPPSVEVANTSTCHIFTVLRSFYQMLKHMKFHIYQPRPAPNYTFLLSIHSGFFFLLFSHVQIGELTFAAPFILFPRVLSTVIH